MKTTFKHILNALAICIFASSVSAQTLHSTYFLEGNNQRHNLNPAFQNETGFVTFPMLGNLYIGANSNIGLGAILVPQGDGMVTFMHKSISTEDALSKFKNNNVIEANIGLNIMTVGFNKWGGSNTVALNLKSFTGAYIPKDIFTFLKAGQTDVTTEYDASNITATTQNYVELAFGHARNITDKLSVGAKVKLLFGAAYSKGHVDNMKIYMSDNKWIINQSSTLIGSKGLNFNTKSDGEIEELKFDNFGLAGFGVGLDLGAIYKIDDNINVSLAVTDIGFISWNDCVYAENKNKEFEFTGFDNIGAEDDDKGNNAFDDAADEVWDNLKGLVKYYDKGKKSSTSSLYTTFRAAGEYGILENKISFGLLASMRVGAPKVWAEGMLTANFRPLKWFNGAVNGSFSNIRSSLGATLNFHPKAVNFFIGMDYFLAKYSKQGIPVDAAKVNIGMGLSFNF